MSLKDDFPAGLAVSARLMSRGRGAPAVFALLAIVFLVLAAVVLWPQQALAFNQEGGLFETISAAALVSAGLAALWRYPGLSRLYIALVCLLLAERELEADIYPVESIPYGILSGLDTLLDLTAVRVVLAVIVIGGAIWHGLPNALRALKLRAPFILIFIGSGLLAVIAQLFEEVSGMSGVNLSETMMVRLFVLEETLEMFFSIGILAAVLIGWPKSEIEETSNDPELRPNLR